MIRQDGGYEKDLVDIAPPCIGKRWMLPY